MSNMVFMHHMLKHVCKVAIAYCMHPMHFYTHAITLNVSLLKPLFKEKELKFLGVKLFFEFQSLNTRSIKRVDNSHLEAKNMNQDLRKKSKVKVRDQEKSKKRKNRP